jgi:hypothetical protein
MGVVFGLAKTEVQQPALRNRNLPEAGFLLLPRWFAPVCQTSSSGLCKSRMTLA